MSRARTTAVIPEQALEMAAAALRVLAHPQRLRIVETIEKRPRSVGEIAAVVGLPQAACSQHLSNMRAHGLLSASREGREVHYAVSDPRAIAVLDCIRKHLCAGTPGRRPTRAAGAREMAS